MPPSLALTGAIVELVLLFRSSIGGDWKFPSGGIVEYGIDITGDAGQNMSENDQFVHRLQMSPSCPQENMRYKVATPKGPNHSQNASGFLLPKGHLD